MAWTITTANSPNPSPQVVSPQTVRDKAALVGNPNAARALAVTVPILSIDLTGTNWSTFGSPPSQEFAFNTGTIALTLRQEIFIADDISACARGVWAVHENLHVQDNINIMPRMPAEIQADSSLQAIFVSKQRFPRGDFSLIQDAVRNMIGDIFRRLTGREVNNRDTRREYSRVNQEISRSCPGPHFHVVESGDSLAKISEFYYGTQRHYPAIYALNRAVIGPNQNMIRPGQRLELPRVTP